MRFFDKNGDMLFEGTVEQFMALERVFEGALSDVARASEARGDGWDAAIVVSGGGDRLFEGPVGMLLRLWEARKPHLSRRRLATPTAPESPPHLGSHSRARERLSGIYMRIRGHCRGCHRDQMCLVVKSRDGGYVSRNCEACGTSNRLRLEELGELRHEDCGGVAQPFVSARKNYSYRCTGCADEIELHELVPRWQEFGQYSGLAATDDEFESARDWSWTWS